MNLNHKIDIKNGLELKQVSIKLGEKNLFNRFNLIVKKGEVSALMGPSGCGKSTLFNYILGCLNQNFFDCEGVISLNGRNLSEVSTANRNIGILFQDALLFPHLNVEENLAFGINSGYSRSEKKEKVANALKQAQLVGFEKKSPDTLSGGQKTRVSLLRTLLAEPEAVLLDEPFSKLDKSLRNDFKEFVFTTLSQLEIPVILVTHDPEDIPFNCVETIQLG